MSQASVTMIPEEPTSSKSQSSQETFIAHSQPSSPPRPQQQELNSWSDYLKQTSDVQWICGVEYFKHAPFGAAKWKDYAQEGMILEVPNPVSDLASYWPAKVFGFAGYYALVEYVKVEENESADPVLCWIPFMSTLPKHLGCFLQTKTLLLPAQETDPVDLSFLKTTYETLFAKGLPTVKPDHWEYCVREIEATATRFKVDEMVEAHDWLYSGQNRIGVITISVGNRIHVKYEGVAEDNGGFWFCQQSEHVHKFGWGHAVGADVHNKERAAIAYPLPPPSEFPMTPAGLKVEVNNLFEMRHPFHLHSICVGRVVKPLRFGYFLAETTWAKPENIVQIVMHVTSDYILLPINFCRKHDIELEIPIKDGQIIRGFSWRKFLADVGFKKLDLSLVVKEAAKFRKGCKLEAVYLIQPKYLGPATVTNVCGHLLRIHFDGYPRTKENYFQWISAESPDIFPAGYAQTIGHKLGAKPDPPIRADIINLVDPKKSATSSK